MAITGPASYLSTTDEFLIHWLLANSALGAGNELILPGGGTQAALQALRDALGIKVDLLQTRLTAMEIARGEIEILKVALHLRLNQLIEKVRALHEGSKWERSLPFVPGINDGAGNFTPPLDVANSVWLLINADATVPDITLLGAYTQAIFATDIASLKSAFTEYITAKTMADVVREERNDLQDEIYEILRKYRRNLPTAFATGHAIVDSMPRLTPEPGSTPDGVIASIVWDPVLQAAKITWTASAAANLSAFQIRFCAGPDYSTDNESVIGTVDPTALREFVTIVGLSNPGNVVSFKVYVITLTGNEKGSNTVTVTRP
ncbi:MAG: hypothetical protein H7062_13380 [Candidatus Saccharimonas sp.]|nr:hypothetical protein [Planctomycetaceae bacterium]